MSVFITFPEPSTLCEYIHLLEEGVNEPTRRYHPQNNQGNTAGRTGDGSTARLDNSILNQYYCDTIHIPTISK